MRTFLSPPGNDVGSLIGYRSDSGMTLVEMLVVLGIIGVMAGVTVLAAGAGAGARDEETEARRLVARLQLAADEAMVTDRRLAFVAQDGGYRFVTWDQDSGAWQPDSVEELGTLHVPTGNVRVESDAGLRPVLVGADGGSGTMHVRFVGSDRAATVTFDGTGGHFAMDTP